ncbi:UPAR/Ly6 domain-containing protein crok-like [Bombus flavifrons]|uniref:UPAR/Ly6 domain-containing protein crok-like n=1 Tax=Bombus flavifrons TaxID=103934 RepID=UPI003704A391
MSSRLTWMLVIFGLVVLSQSGLALRCWDCASNNNILCGDPLNITDHQAAFYTKLCETGSYEPVKHVCRKIVRRENNERVVIRQCSTLNVDEGDITDGPCSTTMTSGRNIIESCHICSTDLCNSATGASITQSLFVVALAIIGYRSLQSKYGIL